MATMKYWFVVLIFGVLAVGVTANAQEPDQKLEKVVDAAVLAFQREMQKQSTHRIWSDSDFARIAIRPLYRKLFREMKIDRTLRPGTQKFETRCIKIGVEIVEAANWVISGKLSVITRT